MATTVGPAAAFALVRRWSFGPYFAGNALSASGTWFQNLAGALLVYRLTHSAFLLVEPHELPTAVALNSMTYNIARAAGPVAAAASVEYLGIPASFLLNAGSYVVFVAALVITRPRPQEKAPRESSRLRDALPLLREDPRLLAFLIVVAAVGFASDPVNTLAPAFAHEFGHRDTIAGAIIGAFGAGAVTAALVVAGRVAGSRRRMAGTFCCSGSASSLSRSRPGFRSRSPSSPSPAWVTSPRTRRPRPGSSSA